MVCQMVAHPDPPNLYDSPLRRHNNDTDLYEHKMRLLRVSLHLLMLFRLLCEGGRMLQLLCAFALLQMLYEVFWQEAKC